MINRRPLILLLLISYLFSSAQMMNVRKWRKSERDSLDNALLFVDEKLYLQALPIFENILNHHPKEEFLKYSYAKCALYRDDKHADAYTYLNEIYQKNKKVPDIQYDMALAAHYNNQFDEALGYLSTYASSKKTSPQGKQDAAKLIRYVTNAKDLYARPTTAKITNLGTEINSPHDESKVAISADESILMLTYAGPESKGGLQNAYLQADITSGVYMDDIFISRRVDKRFKAPLALDSLNSTGPESVLSLSNDGKWLFVYQDLGDGHGDIYLSQMHGGYYSKPVKLKGDVNSYSWEGNCSLSPDNKTLFFSSDRSGGKGGKDIYRASYSAADTAWVNVVNLGDSINTTEDDDAPFIHPDGNTLYFSSRGRNSMGGYDVFKATMNADSTFKNVENLGYPINSPADELGFVMAGNGSRAYFSSGRKEGLGMSDIYMVEPNFKTRPALYIVKGTVRSNGKPQKAIIKTEVLTRNNKVFTTINSDDSTGAYLVSLPGGESYKITYYFAQQPPRALVVNASNIKAFYETVKDVNFDFKVDTEKIVLTTTNPVFKAPLKPQKDGFVPRNKVHEKIIRFAEKYGDISLPGLEFRVQISAYKIPKRYYFPGLGKFGRIEKMDFGDGFTRLMIGPHHKTLNKAFVLNKKVVIAGQSDAFVVAIYNGKKVQLEELEKLGIFK